MFCIKLKRSILKLQSSREGFTLVELIISVVILAIMGLMAGSAFVNWNHSTVNTNYHLALQRELDLAVNRITLSLQEATGATIASYNSGTNNQITINTALTSEVFRFDPSTGALELGGTNIIIDYMNGDIEVENLAFVSSATADGKQQIKTTLSMKFTDTTGTESVVEFRTIITLRNS